METQASFIWPDSTIELNPVTKVDPDISFIINPRYLENDNTIRFNKTLNNPGRLKLGIFIVYLFDRRKNLPYRL